MGGEGFGSEQKVRLKDIGDGGFWRREQGSPGEGGLVIWGAGVDGESDAASVMHAERKGRDGGAEKEGEGAAAGGGDRGAEGGGGGGEVDDDAAFTGELLERALEGGEVVRVGNEGDDRGLDGVELGLDADRKRAVLFDEEGELVVA